MLVANLPFTPMVSEAPCPSVLIGQCLPWIAEQEILVGFACGHIFHLSHVHPEPAPGTDENSSGTHTPMPFPRTPAFDESLLSASRTVGPKVTTARLLRDRIGDRCRICAMVKEIEAIDNDSEEMETTG